MRRGFTANLGWFLIIIGIITMWCLDVNFYSLITIFAGFFLRLIYNSEKYKFFKALNWRLLQIYGKSNFQHKALTSCLYGFYRAVIDLLIVIILPFVIIPMLDIPWYCDYVIGMVYLLALKPIFRDIDYVDKKQIQQIVTAYPDCFCETEMEECKNQKKS